MPTNESKLILAGVDDYNMYIFQYINNDDYDLDFTKGSILYVESTWSND